MRSSVQTVHTKQP